VRLCVASLTDADERVRWLSASRLRWSGCLDEDARRELLAAVTRALDGEGAPRVANIARTLVACNKVD
jgi:hypothetical protein